MVNPIRRTASVARPGLTGLNYAGDVSTSTARTGALSADDWAARGLEILMAEGPRAVTIARLCRDLGVTKGSFYWHFADLEALKGAIAERWCAQNRDELSALAGLNDLPAPERLRQMMLGLIDDGVWALQRALREWARTDARVADALAQSDLFVFTLVQDAIAELGAEPRQARTRAGLLVYAGIGFAHGQSGLPKPTIEQIDDLIGWLTEGSAEATGT